ncbi:MAG: VOC family protein [Acidobacteria bacterium]|nr:VOC family protein [Acidobacteriota bacterium]
MDNDKLTPALSGIHHVSLRVADLDTSLKLYRDTLGFRLKTAFALNDRRFALLDAGNSGYLELVETQTPIHPARADDVIWHFAVRTNDVERALEAVVRAGYEVTRPAKGIDLMDTARDQAFSIRIAFFRGPDGEEIELFEDKQGHT